MRHWRSNRRARGWGLAGTFAALAVWCGTAGAASTAPPACAIPAHMFDYVPYVPRILAALEKDRPVTIVAIGGASTKGRAAGQGNYAWPARLEQALSARFPKARINVVNRGVARNTAAQMAARFDRDVLALRPDLVIWETGTNDAVGGTDIDSFWQALQTGVERLRAAVPEVMLMSPQFSRRSESVVNFNRYIRIMHEIADLNELPLFPRHDIMRDWAENDVFDYAITGREQRRELAIQVYGCIGNGVAAMIVRRPPVPTP